MATSRHQLSAADRSLSPLLSIIVSLAFWVTAFVTSGLFAILVLSDGIREQIQLEQQSAALDAEQQQLVSEISHWEQLAIATARDADFRQRLAEADGLQDESTRIYVAVEERLAFDARKPQLLAIPIPSERSTQQQLKKWIADFSGGAAHLGLQRITLGLAVFATVVLNEPFFSGRVGRWILYGLATLCQRYRSDMDQRDAMGCQHAP